MSEYDHEPVRGLPESLPAGERLLWQGKPNWRALAIRAFHARKVAIYFGLLVLWRVATAVADNESLAVAGPAVLILVGLGAGAVAILALLGWLYSSTTVYTITDRRLVLRFGVALPMAWNLPFEVVNGAAVKTHGDGSGDLPLELAKGNHIAYLHLWPHVRPWRVRHPQPMLRAIEQPQRVAAILANALAVRQGNGVVVAQPLSDAPAVARLTHAAV